MAELPGVIDVESGYANGEYRHLRGRVAHENGCAGKASKRNHAEVVKVTFDPAKVNLDRSSHASGKATIRRRATARATTSAATTAVRSTPAAPHNSRRETDPRDISGSAQGRRPRCHHHRDRPAESLLQGRGIPPGLSEEEPQRLLRPRWHRRGIPGLTPGEGGPVKPPSLPLDPETLNAKRQVIVFEAEDCAYCKQFKTEILDGWNSPSRLPAP